MVSDDGLIPMNIPHLRFALVLCMAKFMHGLSEMFAFEFAEGTYNSIWTSRHIMDAVDPYLGTIVITIGVVTALMLVAIALDVSTSYLPTFTGRDSASYWGAIVIYIGGTIYFVYATAQTLLLLV